MKPDLKDLAIIITTAYTLAKKGKQDLLSLAEIDMFVDNLERVIHRLNQLKEQTKYHEIFQ